jgi:AraC-like DNA-binding protein
VPRRTLEKHFRCFVGCAPLEFLRTERLGQARRKLLMAPPRASVMEIAADCGLNHLGRFAAAYRDRYGETPSETLRWRRVPVSAASSPFRPMASSPRPGLALLPFDLIGPLPSGVEDMPDAIGAALQRTGWIRVVPAHGRASVPLASLLYLL